MQTAVCQIRKKTEERQQKSLFIAQRWGLMLFAVFVVAVLIEPGYIANNPGLAHQIFRVFKVVASGMAVLLFVMRRTKLNGLLTGCLIFEGMLLISTVLNFSNLAEWLKNNAYAVAFLVFLQTVMEMDANILLRALSVVLGAYVHINSLCRILFPNGMYIDGVGNKSCWFLGYDNVACIIIIVAMTVSVFRILSSSRKLLLWDWSVIISGVWFTFVGGIATSIIAETAFLFIVVLASNPRIRRWRGNARLLTISMIGLFLLIHLFSIQQGDFFSLVLRLLNKDITFSGRIEIWQQAWADLIGKKLLLGFGVHTQSEYSQYFGRRWAAHLHCFYLQVLYEGGLAAFGVLLGWIFYVGRRFDKAAHGHCAMTILAGFFSMLIMWQVEAYANLVRCFVIMLFLLYNAQQLEIQSKDMSCPKRRIVFRLHR